MEGLAAAGLMRTCSFAFSRDLKFENIMWESRTSNQIKVIDFGLSKKYLPGKEYMHEGVGTVRCPLCKTVCSFVSLNNSDSSRASIGS